MDYEQTSKLIFTEFVLLESAFNVLNEYIVDLQIDTKEKYKRIIMIKELAKKKIKSTILDEAAISALINETNEFYNIKPKIDTKSNRSFQDMIYEDSSSSDHEMIRCNYIYNNSIIYVDSIRDYPNVSNKIFKSLKIHEDSVKTKQIFSNAIDKPRIFLNHFSLLKHFLLLNPGFKTRYQVNSEGLEISTLDSLIGTQSDVVVMGMILLNEEGKIQLQDNYSIVSIDISECEWGQGYFTQGCIVLVQGQHKNNILKAKCIVHPSPAVNNANLAERFENDYFGAMTKAFKMDAEERKSKSNADYEAINTNHNFLQLNNRNITFNTKSGAAINSISATNKPEENFLLNFLNKDLGSAKYLLPKTIENHIHFNLESMSKSNFNQTVVERIFESSADALQDEFILIISNPDLTNQNVLNAIEKIIVSYNQSNNFVPFMIVFMGNFTPENSYNCFKSYGTAFDNLANILLKNSLIVKNTYIVFIPGPDDFSLFSGYPKHPVIETIINPLKKKIPNIISATNPARFSMFGKEFVFFRDNLNKKFARNSIPKKEMIVNKDCFVYTVLSQGNLSPFDLNVTSKIWHLSQSMSILPLPDFLILGDAVEEFNTNIQNVNVINPGNFSKDFAFTVVSPLRNLVEPCKIIL